MGGKTVIDTSEISKAIERSNQLAAANNQKMMEMMKESSEFHKKEMDLLYKQLKSKNQKQIRPLLHYNFLMIQKHMKVLKNAKQIIPKKNHQ